MNNTLLNKEGIEDYIKKHFPKFYNKNLSINEIGDGNINYVFIVKNNKNQSLVIKKADDLLRSSGRPLDTLRIDIESRFLERAYEYTNKMVPEIYKFDKENSIIVMEDISDYKNLRKVLSDGIIYKDLYKWLIEFLVPVIGNTLSIVEDRHKKKENIRFFINPEMCDISEDLVFTEPYVDYKGRNIIYSGEEEFIGKNFYKNKNLKLEVDKLKEKFMNYSQCLLHGDLHSGSIFINEKGIKVIDSEFAFYGPGGYDIGNVIGHFIIAFVTGLYNGTDLHFLETLEEQIELFFDNIFVQLRKFLINKLDINNYSEEFLDYLLKDMKADTLGYTGTEINRRVIGDTKTAEIEALEGEDRIDRDIRLMNIGNYLIMNREKIEEGKEISKLLEKNWE